MIAFVVTLTWGNATPTKQSRVMISTNWSSVQPLRSLGAHGHHHEPILLVGVLHPDLSTSIRQVQSELREHLARPAHDASADSSGRPVPLEAENFAQDRSRIAGAQRAHDDVMQRGRVCTERQ